MLPKSQNQPIICAYLFTVSYFNICYIGGDPIFDNL